MHWARWVHQAHSFYHHWKGITTSSEVPSLRRDIAKMNIYLWLLPHSCNLSFVCIFALMNIVVHVQSSRGSDPTGHCHQGRMCPADTGCYQASHQDFSASLQGKVFKIQVIIFYSNLHFIFITKTCNQGLIIQPLQFLLLDETLFTNLCLNLVLPFLLSLKVSQPCFSQVKMFGKQKLSAVLKWATNVT